MPIMQFSYGPWQFSEAAQKIIRRFAFMHGKLWPSHLKSLVERAMATGKPIWSPLFYVFPEDETTYLIRDEFMVGDSLLVAPVVEPGVRQRDVYLPEGRWRDFWSEKVLEGGRTLRDHPAPLETIPVFERINPRAPGKVKRARRCGGDSVLVGGYRGQRLQPQRGAELAQGFAAFLIHVQKPQPRQSLGVFPRHLSFATDFFPAPADGEPTLSARFGNPRALHAAPLDTEDFHGDL
jgi:hypothetical protein